MKSTLVLHLAAVGILGTICSQTAAYPVTAGFTIDPTQSSLTVAATASIFSDSDTQSLSGTITGIFDFGNEGGFPSTAGVTVAGALIEPAGNYNLELGFPPTLGVAVTASDLVADISTPAPPASMERLNVAGVVYQFDASDFVVTVDQGMLVITGAASDTTDFSEEPIIGTAEPDTFGTLTFTTLGVSGPYTHLSAAIDFPISFTETTESGGMTVDFTVSGTVRAHASFYVALDGVAGDFDLDGDVDGDDLDVWRDGFGTLVGATAGDGNADGDGDVDGRDLLIWQQALGASPPEAAGAVAVPEPASAALAALVVVLGALMKLRRLQRPSA